MKRLAIVFGVMCLSIFAMFIEKDKKKGSEDDIEFTGPHGEKYW